MRKYYLSMLFAMLMIPLSASAQDDTVLSKLCELYDCIFSNGIIVAIATIAILFLGIGAFFGKVNWGLVLMVGIAIITIAGAYQIALLLLGDDFEVDGCGDGSCEPIVYDAT